MQNKDGNGQQIIRVTIKNDGMSCRNVAQNLEVNWDPDTTIEMESANWSVEKTLGLAKNVLFTCRGITIYLWAHILSSPAYKVLLGWLFDIITESLVKNKKDGGQTLMLIMLAAGHLCRNTLISYCKYV